MIENDMESGYEALESVCDSLQVTVKTMQQVMDEQKIKIESMTQQMDEMKNEIKRFEARFNERANDEVKEKKLKKQKSESESFMASAMKYFDYGWDRMKEREIVSFQRSVWENIYHSLFMYFMNGLMVIFNVLTKICVLVEYLCCCLCSKDESTNAQRLETTKSWEAMSSRSNSRHNLRRRRS